MWSHLTIATSLLGACLACGQGGRSAGSSVSPPGDAPDLTLQSVAFARLSDGRVVARGTARTLDYRRQGGRLVAADGAVTLEPGTNQGFSSFGAMTLRARAVDGEVSGKRGTARGDVRLDAARGDHARTERLDYDGAVVRTDTPVDGQGPGYTVHSRGLLARTDGSSVQLTNHVTGVLDVGAQR
jgi:hypothetical protein